MTSGTLPRAVRWTLVLREATGLAAVLVGLALVFLF